MSTRAIGIALAAALLPATLAAAGDPRTVAVSALFSDRGLRPLEARARAIFEPAIEAWLRDAGYRVVPVRVADSVWISHRDSVGGFYDPFTGRIVEEKFDAVWRGTRRDLAGRFGADAWLQARITAVSPGFGGDRAEWHGTSEETGGRGGLAGFLVGRSVGTLSALSLLVSVEGAGDGQSLYRRFGGIQLSSRITGGRLVEIAFGQLLLDEARNASAVRIALDSLPSRWPPR